VKADDVDDELPERVADREPRQPEVQCGGAGRPGARHVDGALIGRRDVAVQLQNAPRQPDDHVHPADDHADRVQLRPRRLDHDQHWTGAGGGGGGGGLGGGAVADSLVALVGRREDVDVGEAERGERRDGEQDGDCDEVGGLRRPVDDTDGRPPATSSDTKPSRSENKFLRPR